jgi:hypothetical protein
MTTYPSICISCIRLLFLGKVGFSLYIVQYFAKLYVEMDMDI